MATLARRDQPCKIVRFSMQWKSKRIVRQRVLQPLEGSSPPVVDGRLESLRNLIGLQLV